jgi:hypothetical protein
LTSFPFVNRTRATFRRAEFGFFGVAVNTRRQTPRRWGQLVKSGDFEREAFGLRPLRMSCWIVGIGLDETPASLNRTGDESLLSISTASGYGFFVRPAELLVSEHPPETVFVHAPDFRSSFR